MSDAMEIRISAQRRMVLLIPGVLLCIALALAAVGLQRAKEVDAGAVTGDLMRNISLLARIDFVVKGGKLVERSSAGSAARPSPAP